MTQPQPTQVPGHPVLPEDPSARRGLSGAQWMVLAAAFIGWMFDGFEMGLFPVIARPALQDLTGAAAMGAAGEAAIGFWNGIIVACFLVGAAAGGMLFGWLGDKLGRVKAMVFSILVYSIFTGGCYFAQAPWHIGAFRFISALGMGGEWSLGVALVMECWPERHRPLLAGLIGASANVGFLLVSVPGLFIKVTPDSWRWMTLIGIAPAVLGLIIALCVQESAKWKASAAKGGKHPIIAIFSDGLARSTLLAIVFASVALIVTWGVVSSSLPSWAEKLTETVAADGKKVTDPAAKSYCQIAISIGAIIGCMIAPIIGQIFGRRPTYFALCLSSLAICLFLFLTPQAYGVWFLFLVVVVGMTTAAFYGWLPLYLPELFPTRIRATGQGVSFNFARIVAALGAMGMGQLMLLLKGDWASSGAIISLVYIVGMVVIWFAPETKGKPLPE